jgi:hypothetical protein
MSNSLACCSTGAVESGSSCEQEEKFIMFFGLLTPPLTSDTCSSFETKPCENQSTNIGHHVLASPYLKSHIIVQDLSMSCDTLYRLLIV